MTTLVGLCGALRRASTNRMLLHEAARAFAPDRFVEGDLDLPLYNGDIEAEGIPAKVMALVEAIRDADAVIIACPEYNKALSGVMKNALDWISRTKPSPLRDKPLAIMSAADGRAGGERSQFALRLCLVPFRARVLPGPELLVAQASQQFDAEGRLVAESYRKVLDELMEGLRSEIGRNPAVASGGETRGAAPDPGVFRPR